jgi:hypothetical protein
MHDWLYNGIKFDETGIEEYIGFVYLITNNMTSRKYVGKKLFKFSRTKVLKGKKKKVQVESDWKEYFGSNGELKEDVMANGGDKFTKEILFLCKSKSECNYIETREIFTRGALMSDDFYNSWVSCKITKKHVYSALKKQTFLPS